MSISPSDGRALLAIGETMAMVAPMAAERLTDASAFRVDAGGAESNVAAHVVAGGHTACWFSRLGDDALGHRIAGQLRDRGVDSLPSCSTRRIPRVSTSRIRVTA